MPRHPLTCLVLLLCALLAGSCQPAHPQPLSHRTLIVAYYDATPASLKAITEAANEWRYKTNSIVTFDIRLAEYRPSHLEATDVFVEMVKASDPILDGKPNLLGWYSAGRKTLYLIPERLIGPEAYRTVVLHELSHVLGMHHSTTQHAIAYEFPLISPRHITGDDQVAFCQIWKCDPFALPSK